MKTNKFIRRFNIIDFLAVILIVIAVLVSAFYYTREDGLFTKHQFEIEYVIRIDKIENEFIGNLSDNDMLYDSTTSFPLGKISDIKTYPSDQYFSAMEIVVEAVAEVHKGDISVGGVDIFSGKWIDFRTPNLVHGGKCVAVMINEKVEENK